MNVCYSFGNAKGLTEKSVQLEQMRGPNAMGTLQVGESQMAVEQRQVTCTKSPDEDVSAAHRGQLSKHEARRGDV